MLLDLTSLMIQWSNLHNAYGTESTKTSHRNCTYNFIIITLNSIDSLFVVTLVLLYHSSGRILDRCLTSGGEPEEHTKQRCSHEYGFN